jgi:hypothetical protein
MEKQVMNPFIKYLRFIEGARRTTKGRFITTLSRVLAFEVRYKCY